MGVVAKACTEVTLTIAAPGGICDAPYFENKKTEPRFVASTPKKSASAISTIGVNVIRAASLTMTSSVL